MLGTLAVGKTSLVRRFVSSTFSDDYLSTIGVKIEQKQLEIEGNDIVLVLWDLHGDDQFQKLQSSYLKGSSGYLLVGDGTREESFQVVSELHKQAKDTLGEVPYALLSNKCDLTDNWNSCLLDNNPLASEALFSTATSAKTGEGVEEAFNALARALI